MHMSLIRNCKRKEIKAWTAAYGLQQDQQQGDE